MMTRPILSPEQRAAWLRWLATLGAALLAAVLARWGVVIPPPVIPPYTAPETPPAAPREPDSGGGRLAPSEAIGRLTLGNAGCTATIIGPRRADGRWDVLTAAHCSTAPGQIGRLVLPSGRALGVRVRARDTRADACWAETIDTATDLPYALIAENEPPIGAKVWHAGYGVDKPGNREEGVVLAAPDDRGQLRFRLSVSSGDSGGAIVFDADGRVCSAVCCTRSPGTVSDVWGPSVAAIRALRVVLADEPQWIPLPIPIR